MPKNYLVPFDTLKFEDFDPTNNLKTTLYDKLNTTLSYEELKILLYEVFALRFKQLFAN